MLYASKVFWVKATERAVKSAAQALLLVTGLSEAGPVNLFELDWELGAGAALAGALLSYLTSLTTAGVGEPNDPSAV